jgi:hypothetical protein
MPSLLSRKQEATLFEQRDGLRRASRAARLKEREEGEGAVRGLRAEQQATRDRIVRAHAAGDVEAVSRLEGDLERIARELDRAELRAEGLRLAVRQAEQDELRFVAENVDGLLVEQRPGAEAVSDRVERAVEEFEAAVSEWSAVAQHTTELLAQAGRGRAARVKPLPDAVVQAIRQVNRLRQEGAVVHAPVPEGFPYVELLTSDARGELVRVVDTTP